MFKNLILHLYFCLSCFLGCSQSAEWKSIGFLPLELEESSGLVFIPPNSLMHINDGGNKPAIITTDTIGNLIQNYCIPGASNIDWEDLTRDKKGNLYIGDFGNNRNGRTDLTIYKLPVQNVLEGDDNFQLEEIQFKYEDQNQFPPKRKHRNFDTEAMIHIGDSIYLFTKNRTRPFSGYTYCYKLPDTPGNYVAVKVDSFKTGNGPMEVDWIAGAAFRENPRTLILLGYNKLWMFYYFKGTRFFSGKHNVIYFDTFTQKEAVTFKNNSKLYLTDEKNNSKDGLLYELDLPAILYDESGSSTTVDSVAIPDPKFKRNLTVEVYCVGNCDGNWEAFDKRGQRMHFGAFKNLKQGRNVLTIDGKDWKPAKYSIHLIINNRLTKFKVKRKKGN